MPTFQIIILAVINGVVRLASSVRILSVIYFKYLSNFENLYLIIYCYNYFVLEKGMFVHIGSDVSVLS